MVAILKEATYLLGLFNPAPLHCGYCECIPQYKGRHTLQNVCIQPVMLKRERPHLSTNVIAPVEDLYHCCGMDTNSGKLKPSALKVQVVTVDGCAAVSAAICTVNALLHCNAVDQSLRVSSHLLNQNSRAPNVLNQPYVPVQSRLQHLQAGVDSHCNGCR